MTLTLTDHRSLAGAVGVRFLQGAPSHGAGVSRPERIVSLVPSHTESLHDLGLADRVVGRTRFCIHPGPWVESVPHVGGTKDADLQKILDLEPDLVVVDKDENPLALVEALQAEGVEVLWSEIDTVEDAADFLQRLGDRCGVPEAGGRQAKRIRNALADAHEAQRGHEPLPIFCPIWYGPWMTFDATAYPNAVLAAIGLRNAFGDHKGPKYFEVAPEDVAASDAAWALLPTEPFPFHKQRDKVDTASLGPCGAEGRVRIIDGEALTWFGTRTAPGLEELAKVAEGLRDA